MKVIEITVLAIVLFIVINIAVFSICMGAGIFSLSFDYTVELYKDFVIIKIHQLIIVIVSLMISIALNDDDL